VLTGTGRGIHIRDRCCDSGPSCYTILTIPSFYSSRTHGKSDTSFVSVTIGRAGIGDGPLARTSFEERASSVEDAASGVLEEGDRRPR
jgi:hypothetical protein